MDASIRKLMVIDDYKDRMRMLSSAITECRTSRSMETKVNESGLFITHADIAEMPYSMARHVLMGYFNVLLGYPFMAGRIGAMSVYRTRGRGAIARCSMMGTGEVTFNLYYYKNPARFNETMRRCEATGYHPENTTWKSVVYHELGHTLDGYLTKLGICGMTRTGDPVPLSRYVRKHTLRSLGMKVSQIREESSGYAGNRICEWFAECFCEYQESPTPRRMCVEGMYHLDQLLRRQYAQCCVDLLALRGYVQSEVLHASLYRCIG